MGRNSFRKLFNERLKDLTFKGYYKEGNSYVFSSKYVFRILDENDELHTPENLEKLKHCRIMLNKDADYYVIKRELIRLGMNPTDRKFFNLNNI